MATPRPQPRSCPSYNGPRFGPASPDQRHKTEKQEYEYTDECNSDHEHKLLSVTGRDPGRQPHLRLRRARTMPSTILFAAFMGAYRARAPRHATPLMTAPC